MNQDQRKFLIERVNKTFNIQKGRIEAEYKRDKPSLNNYLVAAFLDNSIQFNDIEKLKTKMRETVLRYGSQDKLVEEEHNYRNSIEKKYCKLVPEDLFIIPENYTIALDEYNNFKKEGDAKIEELEAQRDTILLKIQIGSNAVLDKLITQVDNLADLNIMNSQFLLSDGKSS